MSTLCAQIILALLGRDSSDALIAGLILGVTDAHFSTALLTTPSHILWCSDPFPTDQPDRFHYG